MTKAKKNFEEINTSNVFEEQIKAATAEKAPEPIPRQHRDQTPTQELIDQAREQGRTQGRKGCKMHRFNMAFSPKAYQFLFFEQLVLSFDRNHFSYIPDNKTMYYSHVHFDL